MTEETANDFDDFGGEAPAQDAGEPAGYERLNLVEPEDGGDADDDTGKGLKGFPNPEVEECPVVPLGHYGGKVVFAMPEGEIRHEAAAKIGQMLRGDIFASEAGSSFLTYWRDKADKFHRELAAIWFVRKCREAGYWDANREVRLLGVWPGAEGAPVLHLGDEVWLFGGKKVEKRSVADMMRAKSGPLYRVKPPAPRPATRATAADGAWVREQLDLWAFEDLDGEGLTGADILAGWLLPALLGAVAPFRGHLILFGPPEAGKTTLIKFMRELASALAAEVLDSFSEAGFRADISGMARPAFLDEAEAASDGNGPGPVEQALGVLRSMATDRGMVRKQGGMDGGTLTQTAVGAVMLGAVTPPKLESADATRMVEIRLRPIPRTPEGGKDSSSDVKTARERARKLAPALLGRALLGAGRYLEDVATIKAALRRAGESPRTGDLVSMLAAGRRLLLFDKALTPEEADEEVVFWSPLIRQRLAQDGVKNVGAEAFAHLMAAESSLYRSDRRLSIGAMVERLVKGDRDYVDVLKGYGLQLWEDSDPQAWEAARGGPQGRPGPFLIVSNSHPALEKIFAGTRWRDWRRSLSILDDLGDAFRTWPTKPLRYGAGVKQRGLAIPLTPLLDGVPGGGRTRVVPTSVPEEDIVW
ncbi:ATP-binding protein [Caulobacter sp. BP25]|uniref:ATP-binding protein n=1 Tax=Caulobacter sp. BP25 TaxID=2048900 RepID=UPI001F3499B0|nr:ATP-binding protein [Caulobacter sp. BP25]